MRPTWRQSLGRRGAPQPCPCHRGPTSVKGWLMAMVTPWEEGAQWGEHRPRAPRAGGHHGRRRGPPTSAVPLGSPPPLHEKDAHFFLN